MPVHELVAVGGLADRSPLLLQIYADVTGRPISLAASGQCVGSRRRDARRRRGGRRARTATPRSSTPRRAMAASEPGHVSSRTRTPAPPTTRSTATGSSCTTTSAADRARPSWRDCGGGEGERGPPHPASHPSEAARASLRSPLPAGEGQGDGALGCPSPRGPRRVDGVSRRARARRRGLRRRRGRGPRAHRRERRRQVDARPDPRRARCRTTEGEAAARRAGRAASRRRARRSRAASR